MSDQATPASAAGSIEDLYRLTLVDGIPVQSEGRTLRYRVVHLRDTTIADERAALRLAERVVLVGGQHKLIASDADFQYAMTMMHIEALECDGMRIERASIDMQLFGKLTSHDLGLIEARVFLLVMAAEMRYGNLSQAQWEELVKAGGAAAPQPRGQGARLDAPDAQPGPGPALLADFTGQPAHGPGEGDGR